MKKIIVASDGSHFPEGAIEFACRLNELQPILLTGVFLAQSYKAVAIYADANSVVMDKENELYSIHEQVEQFERLCKGNGIDYRVHNDSDGLGLQELEQESRYADLLLASSEAFYKEAGGSEPNAYLEQVLKHASCPILLVPEKFDFPESIVLAYDGSDNAVFAIKQFAYLFPELAGKETILVYASTKTAEAFPDSFQIEELVARHFSSLTLTKLDIDPREYFSTWVASRKTALLVCGSYGRSGLSELFRKSFVKEVIAEHWLPVFIAHR